MSPEAFDFYLNDQSVDAVGAVLFNKTGAFQVKDLQRQEPTPEQQANDMEMPPIGMLCEDVLGHGSQLVVNRTNCQDFEMSFERMPGPLQAIWATCMKEIEDLKKKLRSV